MVIDADEISPIVRLAAARLGPEERLWDLTLRAGNIVDIRPAAAWERERGIRTVDLGGQVVLPGLWDHHVHLDMSALRASRFDVSEAESARHCAQLVAGRLDDAPTSATAIGVGFQDGTWPDAPSAQMLDAVTAGRSVILLSHDLHCAWLNTEALRRWLPGGPTDGIVRENECYELVKRLNDLPEHDLDALVDDAVREAHARGVVGVVEFERRRNLDSWERRARRGTRLRVDCGLYPEHLQDAVDRGLTTGDAVPDTKGLVRMGALKLVLDGSLNTRTAWCIDAYPGMSDPATAQGLPALSPQELSDLVDHGGRSGIDAAIHAIGDLACTAALDVFERSGTTGTIEHAQLVSDVDIPRFARLGIAASVQPRHAIDDRDVADRHWHGRTGRAFPLASMLAAGTRLLFGSDAPVAPLDPWTTIAAAVTRTDDGRPPWHPEQRIGVGEALRASTRIERLVVGAPADLVVLGDDPWALPPDGLASTRVEVTVIDGVPVHGGW